MQPSIGHPLKNISQETQLAIVEQQKAILALYPDEYVVLAGDKLVGHTVDCDEAFELFDAAWAEIGEQTVEHEPMVVPPYPKRGQKPPPVRGRMIPLTVPKNKQKR